MLSVVSPLIAPLSVPGVGEPKYTPLPRPKGLTVGTLAPGEAPAGITPLVNYETRRLPSIPAWYTDRKPTSADCEYVCKQERDCMEQRFDAARSSCALYGRRPTNNTKPSRATTSAPSPTQQPSAARSGALSPPSSAAEPRGVIAGAALRREPAHGNYTNPIVCCNSPDPGAIVRGPEAETVVVVATGGNRKGGAFPLWHSADGGLTFELRRYALPEAPKWWDEEALLSVERVQALVNRSVEGGRTSATTVPGGVTSGTRRRGERFSKELLRKEWARVKLWAPEIHFLNNHYLLYYTATDQSNLLSIGVATSAHVDGPFEDVTGKPLLRYRGDAPLGIIDPTMYVHEGTPHLIWKDDGNAVGEPTPIWIQQLAEDGLSLRGNRHLLITNNASSWEGGVVEGPWLVHREVGGEGYFFLFYSGNAYYDESYSLGVARSKTLHGEYVKAPQPILRTSSDPANPFVGPGHNSVIEDSDGELHAIYHAWYRDEEGEVDWGRGRVLLRDRISWTKDGWPIVGDHGEPSYGARTRTLIRDCPRS